MGSTAEANVEEWAPEHCEGLRVINVISDSAGGTSSGFALKGGYFDFKDVE